MSAFKDFVSNYMKATNNKNKLEDVISLIYKKAKANAEKGVGVLDEDEVEKIIDNATKLLKEKQSATPTPTKVVAVTPKPTQNKTKVNNTNTSNKNKSQPKVSNRDTTLPTSEFNFDQLELF